MKKIDQKNIFFAIGAVHVFRSQFGVCLQKFGGSRPAGLGGDRDCTDSTERLSQIIIRNCWTEMLARSLGHIIILVHFRSKR
jgi:hypothetical protein